MGRGRITRITSAEPKRTPTRLCTSGYGGVVVMSEGSANGIRDLARKARRGEDLTDQEQGILCLACVGTGDARWIAGAVICKRSRCKYRSSRSSRYFRERITPILSDIKQLPPKGYKIPPGGNDR